MLTEWFAWIFSKVLPSKQPVQSTRVKYQQKESYLAFYRNLDNLFPFF